MRARFVRINNHDTQSPNKFLCFMHIVVTRLRYCVRWPYVQITTVIPLQLRQKYYITNYEELGFSYNLLR